MSQALEGLSILTSWTNSDKAVVHLVETDDGEKIIVKVYRPGFAATMFQEYFVSRYVASRLSIVPRVLSFAPRRRELRFSYVTGQRVLEWVLQRFGDKDLCLAEFQSFRGLDPPDNVDPRVASAFARFRGSTSPEAETLKRALKASYSDLHSIRIVHGSPNPRNAIYDQGKLFIIDFDHARPCLNAASIDYRELDYWYGLRHQEFTMR